MSEQYQAQGQDEHYHHPDDDPAIKKTPEEEAAEEAEEIEKQPLDDDDKLVLSMAATIYTKPNLTGPDALKTAQTLVTALKTQKYEKEKSGNGFATAKVN
jgi:hypothetical protein